MTVSIPFMEVTPKYPKKIDGNKEVNYAVRDIMLVDILKSKIEI
jgi:hypothetical protein